jgi:uncharacterized protein
MNTRISFDIAKKIIEFMYRNTPTEENIEFGFFGGEPLLEFALIKDITKYIEQHSMFDRERIRLTIVTNGTLYNEEIRDFVTEHDMSFGISCDGPSHVQDVFRRFPNGKKSSAIVEQTIRKAVRSLPCVMVNAVYTPKTVQYLPEVVDYFSDLGFRQIYLNADYSAKWTPEDCSLLDAAYRQVADRYIQFYQNNDPHYISIIDSKITVILRNGYQLMERCRMGRGEYAFIPDGKIYPCERLIGKGDDNHCIGNIESGINPDLMACHTSSKGEINKECQSCGIRDYCMNWCGCSNYLATGYYNRVSPFLCASEKIAIKTAFDVYTRIETLFDKPFLEHINGHPLINSILGTNRR